VDEGSCLFLNAELGRSTSASLCIAPSTRGCGHSDYSGGTWLRLLNAGSTYVRQEVDTSLILRIDASPETLNG
jgi:hypothetical protein